MSRRVSTHLGDVRAAQVSSVGEEETTKTQARKAKKQQDQSGTDQRWVVGQAEMQVVPCLAAAHGEQRGLSLREEPAGGQEGRTGQEPASKKALTHFIQREVKALGREGTCPRPHSQSVWQSQDRNPRLLTPSVHLHAPLNKCLLNFISEVIKAEAEQSSCAGKRNSKRRILQGRNSGSSCSGAMVWPGFQLRVQTSKRRTKKTPLWS